MFFVKDFCRCGCILVVAKILGAMDLDAEQTVDAASGSFESDLKNVGQCRDKAAFKRLFLHFAPRLKTYLRKLNASDELCEDIIQDVMVTIWRRAPQYDPNRAAASTWIYTIARNRRIDIFRRRRGDEVEFEEYYETDLVPSGFDLFATKEVESKIAEAIDQLPEKQSQMLRIFYFEDKTHLEIAEELALPLGTVKSRLRLAINKLRSLIEKESL